MKAYTTFGIDHCSFDKKTYIATFVFSFDDEIFFTESIDFSQTKIAWRKVETDTMDMLLFHLSIALWVSYYKLFPTKTIDVKHGTLDTSQQAFWHDFYIQGLGEFFYTNKIDFNDLAHFTSSSKHTHVAATYPLGDTYLVPIGGGKDSCVSIELLRQKNKDITLYTNGKDYEIHKWVAEIAWYKRILTKRTIDPLLIQMTEQWYYNGHVPITGIISFISLIVSYLYDFKHIVFSNERSADFGNTVRHGIEINHQWSKSEAFERAFQAYTQTYIHPEVSYNSILRPWYELRIAKEFAQHKKYFPAFSSCNRNFHITWSRTDKRCNTCPKCLFTYMILRPYITTSDIQKIWWKELYDNKELLSSFQELWGVQGIKPFECVGTYDEAQYATRLYLSSLKKEDAKTSPVVTWFQEHILPTRKQHERETLWHDLSQTY